MREIEFNNGFITAIALFLEHKNRKDDLSRNQKGMIISDLRLYGATDHLFDLEIPKFVKTHMPADMEKVLVKIIKWKEECLNYRLSNLETMEVADRLFKEAEDILKMIDEKMFKTKKVVMHYR